MTLNPTGKYSAHHYFFINNVFGSFISGIGDFFRTDMFPRTTEIVIGTYAKAVQHYTNRQTEAGEKHIPKFPFLTLDPGLDFEPDDRAGRFLHGYPSFDKKFAMKEYNPKIYQDDNLLIAPVLNRYKGRIELIVWCSSIYENIDYRVMTYQYFGGVDRPIYPKNIEGFFILPEEIVFYTYSNRYTGEVYGIDWTKTPVGTILVKNINQDKYVFPFVITPWIKLLGVSDATEKYGADDLGEAKLSIELEWECSLPTHLIFLADELPDRCCDVHFDMGVGFKYKMTPEGADYVPQEIVTKIRKEDGTFENKDFHYYKEYTYQLTAQDVLNLNSDQNVSIPIPEPLERYSVIVNAKYGRMEEDFHWRFTSCPKEPNEVSSIIELIGFKIKNLFEGDIISIALYQED